MPQHQRRCPGPATVPSTAPREFSPAAPGFAAPHRALRASIRPASPAPSQVAPGASPNLVFINVSPIEYGHVLLVPRALDNLPQLVGPDTLLLALQFAREAGAPGVLARGRRAARPSDALPLRAWLSLFAAAQ